MEAFLVVVIIVMVVVVIGLCLNRKPSSNCTGCARLQVISSILLAVIATNHMGASFGQTQDLLREAQRIACEGICTENQVPQTPEPQTSQTE